MRAYFLKRIFWMFPTFLGITFLTFFIVKLAPDHTRHMRLLLAGGGLAPDELAHIQNETALARPRTVRFMASFCPENATSTICRGTRFLVQSVAEYFSWVGRFVRGDWGYSSHDYRPVSGKLKAALPTTLMINGLALLIIYGVSLPLGLWSSQHDGSRIEKIFSIKLVFLFAMPTFWLASLMLTYLAGGDYLNWFPLGGLRSDGFEHFSLLEKFVDVCWHLTLPILVTSLGGFAFLTRFAKDNFNDVFKSEFVRTAYAKGLSRRHIVRRHVLRNALLPFVTLMGGLLPAMIGGSVIVEQIFAIPGMGFLGFEAVLNQDYNVIMAIATLGAILTLLGMLLQDLLYAWLDPRVRFS